MAFGYMWTESKRYGELDEKYRGLSGAEYAKALESIDAKVEEKRQEIAEKRARITAGEIEIEEKMQVSLTEARNLVRRMDVKLLKKAVCGDKKSKKKWKKRKKKGKYLDDSKRIYDANNPHPLIEKTMQATFLILYQTEAPQLKDLKLPRWTEIQRRVRRNGDQLKTNAVVFNARRMTLHQRRFVKRNFLCDTAKRIKQRRHLEVVLDWWASARYAQSLSNGAPEKGTDTDKAADKESDKASQLVVAVISKDTAFPLTLLAETETKEDGASDSEKMDTQMDSQAMSSSSDAGQDKDIDIKKKEEEEGSVSDDEESDESVDLEEEGIYIPRDVRWMISLFAGVGAASISPHNVNVISRVVARLSSFVVSSVEYSGHWWMNIQPLKREARLLQREIKSLNQEKAFVSYRRDRHAQAQARERALEQARDDTS